MLSRAAQQGRPRPANLPATYDQNSGWVNEWNARKPESSYAGQSWELTYPSSKYLFGAADDRDYETDLAGFGRVYPHAYGEADDKYFNTKLTPSPAGDELTLDFAKTLSIAPSAVLEKAV